MDKLEVKDSPIARAEIVNEEQARNWLLSLVDDMKSWRDKCNVAVPSAHPILVRAQQRDMWTFLTKQGQVVGALQALKLTGLISDACFEELSQMAINTLIPSVVG